jgi:hypothetical protein
MSKHRPPQPHTHNCPNEQGEMRQLTQSLSVRLYERMICSTDTNRNPATQG